MDVDRKRLRDDCQGSTLGLVWMWLRHWRGFAARVLPQRDKALGCLDPLAQSKDPSAERSLVGCAVGKRTDATSRFRNDQTLTR
jgi:hypothetical protein